MNPTGSRIVFNSPLPWILAHSGVIVHVLGEQVLLCPAVGGGAGAGHRWRRRGGGGSGGLGARGWGGRQAVLVEVVLLWEQGPPGAAVQQPLHRHHVRPGEERVTLAVCLWLSV